MNKSIIFSLLLLLLFTNNSFAQSIKALEDQLNRTEDLSEKMRLHYEIAVKVLNSDPAKASEYAHMAYNNATDLKNNLMLGKSSYINAEGFYRRRDMSNAKIRYERSLGHAKSAGDGNTALQCYKKLQEIAVSNSDFRAAYTYGQQAIDMLSKGVVKQATENFSSSSSNAAWQKEKEQLLKEKRALELQLSSTSQEKEKLNYDKTKLATDKTKLSKEKEKVEQSLSTITTNLNEKEKAISQMSAQQAKLEAIKANREKQIAILKKSQAEDELVLQKKQNEIKLKDLQLEKNANLRNMLLLVSGSGIALAGLAFSRYRSKKKANVALEDKNKIIEQEQERSEKLLLNILPPAIAQELKEKGKAIARRYEESTVLFTDFKNFTNIAERLSPEELVSQLDFYFKGFDAIIKKYNIEKIKTIGDAYMCAAGLSGKKSDATAMVKAAYEMKEFMKTAQYEKEANSLPFFEARIGIHTGPVVAGVVGDDKFAYDIWGDTVNIAARMEQHCEPGEINISESTYWQVRYTFDCQYRGKIHAKNKGEIDMYYVKNLLD
jgi:adenylate cyclase